jgi:predicted Rossmann fold nucleotide-binding protein DprA/Smf involved in DNA uptake
MLHERQLVITGDPEGAIDFFDGTGRQVGGPRPDAGMTQGGSPDGAAPLGSMLSADDGRLLAAMGARGGWSVDDLCEATGLPPQAVGATLIFFELAGRVRCDLAGRYRAVH